MEPVSRRVAAMRLRLRSDLRTLAEWCNLCGNGRGAKNRSPSSLTGASQILVDKKRLL